MRKLIAIVLAAVLIVVIVFPSSGFKLSEPQKDTVNSLGYPNQFAISYMPTGTEDSPTLTRNEVWYYPEYDLKITFVAGKVFSVDEYTDTLADEVEPTNLKPENFYFDQSIRKINSKLHGKAEKIDEYEDNITDYASEEVYFTIQEKKLVYFQTLGFIYEEE